MKRILLTLTIFIVGLTLSQGQHLSPLDEQLYVTQLIQQAKNNDSTQIIGNLLLSDYWSQRDSSKSLHYLQQAKTTKYKSILKKYEPYFGAIYQLHQGNKKEAIKGFENSIQVLQPYNDSLSKQLLALSYYQHSYIQLSNKGYQSIVETITNQCIPLAQKIDNKELEAYFYTQMGLAFMSVGQFDKADIQHKKALTLLEKLPTNSTHLITYLNMISNYCYQANSAAAKPYLDKASVLINTYPKSQHITNYYYQLAMFQTTKTLYPQALETLAKGIQEAKSRNQKQLLQLMHFRTYNVYLMQKNYKEAKLYMEKILAEGILTQEAVNRKIVYSQMAYVNELLDNYKEAYDWQKKATVLSDSLQQANLLEKMNELEVLHRTAEQQNTIDNLKLIQVENELVAKNNNIKLLIAASALAILLLLTIFLFINSKNQKKLNTQISINHQQELQRLEDQRKYDASQAILIGEENERKRIAQDLHDSVGGMLAAISMRLNHSDKTENSLDQIKLQLDHSLAELRRISRNIMPATLQDYGIETAIRELCESISTHKTQIYFEAFELSDAIPFPVQLALYRVCQEAISNILKYADASEVIVQLSQSTNSIQLTIEDNGKGFDPNVVQYGLGIKNMQNRMQLINASITIDSKPNHGTTILALCPIL